MYTCSPITINSKWIKDPNVRGKSIKVLEGNIDVKLHDLGLGSGFLAMTPKAQAKKKIDKMDFIKIKFVLQRAQENEKTTDRTRKNICKSYI